MCRYTSNQRNNLHVKEYQNHIRHRIFCQSPPFHREENYNNVNCLAIRIASFDNDLADINRRSTVPSALLRVIFIHSYRRTMHPWFTRRNRPFLVLISRVGTGERSTGSRRHCFPLCLSWPSIDSGRIRNNER